MTVPKVLTVVSTVTSLVTIERGGRCCAVSGEDHIIADRAARFAAAGDGPVKPSIALDQRMLNWHYHVTY